MRGLAAALAVAALAAGGHAAAAVHAKPKPPARSEAQATAVEAFMPLAKTEAAARAGDANAQTHLGDDYLLGQDGAPKDVARARHWYELAAAQGQPNAAFVLGEIYWNGDGVVKDNAAAAKWWKVAFDKGRFDAAKLLGDEAFARAHSEGGGWNLAALREALEWYHKDADTAAAPLLDKAKARIQQVQELIAYAQRNGGG